jgi:hypothetical protein
MSLKLAGRLIQSVEQISEHTRLALRLVDGGSHWLHWAITEPGPWYEFADESELAGAVQQGLHGDPLTLLPKLKVLVSPIKLMTLGSGDLKVLLRAEEGESGPKFDAHWKGILENHGIRTQADLEKSAAFLDELGVRQDPLFQVLTLGDLIGLEQLLWTPEDGAPPDAALQKEAAAFGLEQGRSPREFVDYYQVYLTLAAKHPKADTPAKRRSHAERALHALLPPLLACIDCPEVATPAGPADVAEAIRTWAGWGKPLGFTRISAGVREIVRHTRYRGEAGAEAREYVSLYVAAAQSMLAAAPPKWGIMGQDGATCRFPVHSGEHEGEVLLAPNGDISLAWFRRTSKHKHSPASAKAQASAYEMEPTA